MHNLMCSVHIFLCVFTINKGAARMGRPFVYFWYRRRDSNSQGIAPGGF